MTLTIAIGPVTKAFLIYVTKAPRAFDGFGTLTLHENDVEGRVVGVIPEHLGWQLSRYGSAFYQAFPIEGSDFSGAEERDLAAVIWDRLYGTKEV